MSRGKYLSLEEARKAGQLGQFAKEHPIEDVHPQARSRFKRLLEAAVKCKGKVIQKDKPTEKPNFNHGDRRRLVGHPSTSTTGPPRGPRPSDDEICQVSGLCGERFSRNHFSITY